MSEKPSTAATEAYYQDFWLSAGAEDWRRVNGRHLRIRLELARLLGGARGLRILDVGCGAGVLTSELCRYGEVTGTDLSEPAIALAAELEPRASFRAGRFQDLDLGGSFDLITLFDVLEHVPPAERPDFFRRLDELLSPRGWLILTSPHPAFTRWLREREPELLQIVDSPVALGEVLNLAADRDLELVAYRTYDVDRPGVRQYQLLAFARTAGEAHAFPAGGLARRLAVVLVSLPTTPVPQVRRLAQAVRLARGGRAEAARWLVGRSDAMLGQTVR